MFSGLRWRLTLWYTGIFGLVLLVFGLSSYAFVRHTLYQGIDEGSHLIAQGVAQTLELEDARVRVKQQDFFDEGEEAGLFSDARLIEVLDASGRPVLRHGSPMRLPGPPTAGNHTIWVGPQPMRLHVMALRENGRVEAYVRIVRPLSEANRALQRFGLALVALILSALGLTVVAGRFLAAQAMRPVQGAFERLQRFTADASHELRTPVAIVQTQAEVLAAHPPADPDQVRQALEPILRASKRMATLVADILFLARSDSGVQEVQAIRLDLDELAEEVVSDLAGEAAAKSLVLTFSGEPTAVWGDPERLNRLASNLVGNAVKYTDRGTVRVSVRPDVERHLARLIVQDTGQGIEPTHLAHVFERFYRAEAARESRKPGTGLGLAIARAVAEAHHGAIQLDSRQGVGTTVTVELPLCR